MKIGSQIISFLWPGNPANIGPNLINDKIAPISIKIS
jgi:hypothetical protein